MGLLFEKKEVTNGLGVVIYVFNSGSRDGGRRIALSLRLARDTAARTRLAGTASHTNNKRLDVMSLPPNPWKAKADGWMGL